MPYTIAQWITSQCQDYNICERVDYGAVWLASATHKYPGSFNCCLIIIIVHSVITHAVVVFVPNVRTSVPGFLTAYRFTGTWRINRLTTNSGACSGFRFFSIVLELNAWGENLCVFHETMFNVWTYIQDFATLICCLEIFEWIFDCLQVKTRELPGNLEIRLKLNKRKQMSTQLRRKTNQNNEEIRREQQKCCCQRMWKDFVFFHLLGTYVDLVTRVDWRFKFA